MFKECLDIQTFNQRQNNLLLLLISIIINNDFRQNNLLLLLISIIINNDFRQNNLLLLLIYNFRPVGNELCILDKMGLDKVGISQITIYNECLVNYSNSGLVILLYKAILNKYMDKFNTIYIHVVSAVQWTNIKSDLFSH